MNWVKVTPETMPPKGVPVLLWTFPDTKPAHPVVAMWHGAYFYNALGAWWVEEVDHWCAIAPPADAEGTR